MKLIICWQLLRIRVIVRASFVAFRIFKEVCAIECILSINHLQCWNDLQMLSQSKSVTKSWNYSTVTVYSLHDHNFKPTQLTTTQHRHWSAAALLIVFVFIFTCYRLSQFYRTRLQMFFFWTRLETLDKLACVDNSNSSSNNSNDMETFWYFLQIIQIIKILSTCVWPFTWMCVAIKLTHFRHHVASFLFIIFIFAHEQVDLLNIGVTSSANEKSATRRRALLA